PVVDLSLEPGAFERLRLKPTHLRTLATEGFVLLNFYSRGKKDFEKWETATEFHDLLKPGLCYVNGARVDAYFQRRDSRYRERVSRHQRTLQKLIAGAGKASSGWHGPSQRRDETAHIPLGIRWAYLDTLQPSLGARLSRLAKAGDL